MKRILSLVLALLLCLLPVAGAGAGFTDLPEGSTYYKAVTTLVELGVMRGYEDGSFHPEGLLTRAEATVMVMRAVGFDDARWMKSSIPLYSDVPLTHWASGYIYAATARGVVNGFEDGSFQPDADVTYEQMIKMMVVQMGYEDVMPDLSYPDNYLAVSADTIGNLDQVNGAVGVPLTRGQSAQLIYNSIDVPLMQGGEKTEFTLRSKYIEASMGIEKAEEPSVGYGSVGGSASKGAAMTEVTTGRVGGGGSASSVSDSVSYAPPAAAPVPDGTGVPVAEPAPPVTASPAPVPEPTEDSEITPEPSAPPVDVTSTPAPTEPPVDVIPTPTPVTPTPEPSTPPADVSPTPTPVTPTPSVPPVDVSPTPTPDPTLTPTPTITPTPTPTPTLTPTPTPSPVPTAGPKAGQLTAGVWCDNDHWDFWMNLMSNKEWHSLQSAWGISTDRYVIFVQNAGTPVPGAKVTLTDSGNNAVWSAITDIKGKALIFADVSGADQQQNEFNLTVVSGADTVELKPVALTADVPLTIEIAPAPVSDVLDLMFMIDTTGSMSDELQYIKEELRDVIGRLDTDVRLSCNYYRDIRDEYVVRPFDFTTNVDRALEQMAQQRAAGGGDYPEAVDLALLNAVNEHEWSESARARLMFLVLDAPPHYTPEVVANLKTAVKTAAEKGIKIIPVASSGVDKSTEFFLRSLSIATDGTYIFLTNDSGIGNSHIAPTIGEYQVEFLNELMLKVIKQYIGQE